MRYLIITVIAVIGFRIALTRSQASVEPRTVQSSDQKLQLTLPTGWETTTLPFRREIDVLQAKCIGKNTYLNIVSEPKSDLSFRSLQEYADAIIKIEAGTSQLQNRALTGPDKIVIKGKNALRYQAVGTRQSIIVLCIKTFIETPHRWNQILILTTPSHLEDIQDDVRRIVEDFEECGG
jgi:hypothetical protein